MNNEEQKQLLSAYFDNEVTPEERAEIERLLESSTDSRQSLEEMDQLSDLIRSLPKQAAPETLSSAVMQRAEREMLLPIPPTAISTPSTDRKRSRWAWASGLLVTAMMLFVITRLLPVQYSEEGPAKTTITANEGKTGFFDRLEMEEGSKSDESAKSAEVIASADRIKTSSTHVGTAVAMKNPENSITKGESGFIGQGRMAVASRKADFRDVDWSKIQVGEIFSYNDKSGDQITVVEVTVVDVQKALGEMQLLLAHNDIPQATVTQLNKMKKGKNDSKENVFGKKKTKTVPHKQSQRMYAQRPALFVETSETQLAATLTALQKRDLFLNVQPQMTQVASIDIDNQLANLNYLSRHQLRHMKKSKVLAKNDFGQSTPAFATGEVKRESQAGANNATPTIKSPPDDSLANGHQKKLSEEKKKSEAPAPRRSRSKTIYSYQMLVKIDKPAPSPEGVADKTNKDIKELPPSPRLSAKAKEGNFKDREMKTRKKNLSFKKEEIASKGRTPHNKQPSTGALLSKTGGKPQDNTDGNARKMLQASRTVRVLFVFSKIDRPTPNAAPKPRQN